MQAVVKNPLADPYILGISSGASLGATAAILLGIGVALGENFVGIAAFIGAFAMSLGVLEYKILSSGSITVAHTDNGYKITSTLVTREGETFTVNYEGQLVFEDYSGDSTDNLMKDAVDNTVFNTLTITAHGGDADYHRYTLQLFDGNENNGVITDGVVMHIDLFSTAPDNDQIVIADGTYDGTACHAHNGTNVAATRTVGYTTNGSAEYRTEVSSRAGAILGACATTAQQECGSKHHGQSLFHISLSLF